MAAHSEQAYSSTFWVGGRPRESRVSITCCSQLHPSPQHPPHNVKKLAYTTASNCIPFHTANTKHHKTQATAMSHRTMHSRTC